MAALVPAHNLGMLLMYCAADAALSYRYALPRTRLRYLKRVCIECAAVFSRTVLWWCLGLSACHCVVFLFVPESPSYLAAHGKAKVSPQF